MTSPGTQRDGELEMERQTRTEYVFSLEKWGGGWAPENALQFWSWIAAHIGSIPAEFRDHAKLTIDSESGYEGSHSPTMELSYTRPETDEEMHARYAEQEARSNRQRLEEMHELARLKAKYG